MIDDCAGPNRQGVVDGGGEEIKSALEQVLHAAPTYEMPTNACAQQTIGSPEINYSLCLFALLSSAACVTPSSVTQLTQHRQWLPQQPRPRLYLLALVL